MAQFTVHDAKTNLSRLIADALAGGDVVIADVADWNEANHQLSSLHE